jgi:hypothetical protein
MWTLPGLISASRTQTSNQYFPAQAPVLNRMVLLYALPLLLFTGTVTIKRSTLTSDLGLAAAIAGGMLGTFHGSGRLPRPNRSLTPSGRSCRSPAARLLHEVAYLASTTACWLSLTRAVPACEPAAFGGVDGDGREAGAGAASRVAPMRGPVCAIRSPGPVARRRVSRVPGWAPRAQCPCASFLPAGCRRRCRPHEGWLVPGR